MKIKDAFLNGFTNFFRLKKNKTVLFVTVICAITTYILIVGFESFINYIDLNYVKNIGFRTLNVFYGENSNSKEDIDEEKIKNINHVVEVFNSKYASYSVYSNLKDEFVDGIITLVPFSKEIYPNVSFGDKLDNSYDVLICPINFYPDSSASDIAKGVNTNGIIKDGKIKGQKIEISYNKYLVSEDNMIIDEHIEKEFEVIDVYDIGIMMNSANQCYISMEDMKEIVDGKQGNNIKTSTYVFVDDINNLNYVIEEIENIGYVATVASEIDSNITSKITLIFALIIFISTFVLTITLCLYNKKRICFERKNMGVLRTCGYSKKNIINYYFIQEFFVNLFVYLISFLILVIVYFIINMIFYKFLIIHNIKIAFSNLGFVVSLVTIFIIPFLTSIVYIIYFSNRKIVESIRTEE